MTANHLNFECIGKGPTRVLVLHDWFCDRSSWDPMTPYLTLDRFTYAFIDLRGYGASREMPGRFTLEEAAQDVIALADHLNWTKFSMIGHSMSSLIVQRVAQLVSERIERLVAVTPVPPTSLKLDAATADSLRSLALADDESRFSQLAARSGSRLSETWMRYKIRKWRETADPKAVARYVDLWGCTDISDGARGIKTPLLIVAGGQDAPWFQAAALTETMLPFYPNAKLLSLAESGHYPMQEQPPLLATVIERFLVGSEVDVTREEQ